MRCIIDIETDGFEGKTLWVIVSKDVDTGKVTTFTEGNFKDFEEYAAGVDQFIGHNIINFDFPVLQRHFPGLQEPRKGLYDTLVASRLIWYSIEGGHSLEAWGSRLKLPKIAFDKFDQFSEEMVTYCKQDVEVTHKLFDFQARFREDPEWASAFETEHRAASMCQDMHRDGFPFDYVGAQELYKELLALQQELDAAILEGFKPAVVEGRTITPRRTKHGTLNASDFRWVDRDASGAIDLSPYEEGCSFTRISYEPFNPGSPKQVVDRLNKIGWKPYEKTKGHLLYSREKYPDPAKLRQFEEYGWSVSEANLSTLPSDAPPAAQKLAQRLTVSARVSDLVEWMREYNHETGCIHGSFLSIGSWTNRMAHQRPNTGNISGVFNKDAGLPRSPVEQIKETYDGRMRALWRVRVGHWQIGVDMESAHLRILAHLMDEKDFTFAVTSGSKKDKTDPHSMNQKALGAVCKSRDDAKTFIYLWLNGGGAAKLAATLRWPLSEAKAALKTFTAFYPGLKRLMDTIVPADAKKGYFVGIDGRKVAYSKEHGMLAGYLQNAESIILKRAAWHGREKCRSLGIPIKLLNLVHDEVQIELFSDDKELAQKVGEIFAEEYKNAAEFYGLRCPFAGGITVGKNWAGAH